MSTYRNLFMNILPLSVKDLTDLITAAVAILFLTCVGCCWAWKALSGSLTLSSKCHVLQGAPVVQWLSLWRFWMIFFEILYDILRILWGWTGFHKLTLGLDFICYGLDWISYAWDWTGLHMSEIGLDFVTLSLDWIPDWEPNGFCELWLDGNFLSLLQVD
jgi:hypothetical protein